VARRRDARKRRGVLTLRGPVIDGRECRSAIAVESPARGQRLTVTAIVDSGCTAIAIRRDIAVRLGLPVVDMREISTASSGTARIRTELVVGAIHLRDEGRTSTSLHEMLVTDMEDEMLFGMAGMKGGILTVDLVRNRWEWRLVVVDT
jgi:predicted aspartyl protease